MAITRRPHTRVDKRLYRFDDTGEYFVVVAGMLGRSGKRLHQHLVRLGACSLNQARVRRDEIYAEVDAGTYRKETTHTVPTVGEMTAQWMEERTMLGLSPETQRVVRHQAAHWARFRDLPVTHLDYQTHLRPWAAGLLKQLHSNTARKVVSRLRAVLRRCQQLGIIDSNPAELIVLPRTTSRKKTLPEWATVEKALEGFDAYDRECIDAREAGYMRATYLGFGPFMRLLTELAMRHGELRQARWDWVEGSTLTIPPEAEKTRRGRDLPLSDGQLALLDTHARTMQRVGTDAQRAHLPSGLIFPSRRGKAWGHGMVRGKVWQAVWGRLGVQTGRDAVHPHTLRAVGIARLIERLSASGAKDPRRVVMSMVGHSSIAMQDHYNRVTESEVAEAIRALDATKKGQARDKGTSDTTAPGVTIEKQEGM